MLKNLAEEISLKLVCNKIITIENRKYYTYGVELVLNNFFICLSIAIISILSNKFLMSFIFAFTYCMLRAYVGGYHCKSYLRCYCTSITIYTLMLIFNYFLIGNIKVHFSYAIVGISVPMIFIFAPIEYGDKPLSINTKRRYWMKSIILTTVAVIGFVIINITNLIEISFSIAWAIFMVFFMMLLSIISDFFKARRKKVEN